MESNTKNIPYFIYVLEKFRTEVYNMTINNIDQLFFTYLDYLRYNNITSNNLQVINEELKVSIGTIVRIINNRITDITKVDKYSIDDIKSIKAYMELNIICNNIAEFIELYNSNNYSDYDKIHSLSEEFFDNVEFLLREIKQLNIEGEDIKLKLKALKEGIKELEKEMATKVNKLYVQLNFDKEKESYRKMGDAIIVLDIFKTIYENRILPEREVEKNIYKPHNLPLSLVERLFNLFADTKGVREKIIHEYSSQNRYENQYSKYNLILQKVLLT